MKIWKKLVKFLTNKTIYLVCAIVTTLFIVIILIGQTTENYTVDRLLAVAKGQESQYTINSGNYSPEYKKFVFVVKSPHWSIFNQGELIIDSTQAADTFKNLKEAGFNVQTEHSFWINVKERPIMALVWVLITFIMGFALCLLYPFNDNKNNRKFMVMSGQEDYGRHNSPSIKQNNYNLNQAEPVEEKKLSFDDVAGIDEVKEQIIEIVELFKDNSKIVEMGGKNPKGIILNGPPGTGKTLLAKVTASQCEANFIHASGSDFVEMYVGVGARRVRDLFQRARRASPCILFIDEIDAVAGKRGSDNNSEREQTLNQLLTEMDGFEKRDNILVFAATNQIEKLDPAILRPGRFDRRVEVHLPDEIGREKILKIYLNKAKTDSSININEIARSTSGFSGADIENLVNEGILFAAKNKKNKIGHNDLIWAKDKILMGAERRIKMNEDDREQTAYHEIGHAFLCYHLKLAKLINISIVPRGRALGVTQMESEDILTLKHEKAIHQLAMMMGGRVAENIFFDHYSTGAQNDLQRAWSLTRNLVAHWGMSELGPIALDEFSYRMVSEETRKNIDVEIINILKKAETLAEEILLNNKELIKNLAKSLLVKQTLSIKEFESLLANFYKSAK